MFSSTMSGRGAKTKGKVLYSEQANEDFFLKEMEDVGGYEHGAKLWAEGLVDSDSDPHGYVSCDSFRDVALHRLLLMATSDRDDIRKAVLNAIDVFKDALQSHKGNRCLYGAKGLRMLSDCNTEMKAAIVARGVVRYLVIVGKRSCTSAESVDAMATLHNLSCHRDDTTISEIFHWGGQEVFMNFMKAKQMGHLAYPGLAHMALRCSNERKLRLVSNGAIDMCVKIFREDRISKTSMDAKFHAVECIRNFIGDANQTLIDILYEKKAIETLFRIVHFDHDPMFLEVAIHGLYLAYEYGDDDFKQKLVSKHDFVNAMMFHVRSQDDDVANRAARVLASLASGGEDIKRELLQKDLIECLVERAQAKYGNDDPQFAEAVSVILLNLSRSGDEANVEAFLKRGAKGLAERTQDYLIEHSKNELFKDESRKAVLTIAELEAHQKEIEELRSQMQMMGHRDAL